MIPTPGAAAPAAVVGETIGGKYYVEQVLGAGGMGVVVRARHIALGSRVALKFMHRELLGDAEMRVRFRGEAERVALLQSEHVARVLDVGELADGVPYIVMEYVEGSDLGAILRERGPLPVAESVDYLLQACEGIAEAHSRGIVHRDIKPANLFVAQRHDGSTQVKVLDFGIAKTLPQGAAPTHQLTKTYATMGSPFYSAPEQLESASHADQRSDIWALAVTLTELLTGQGPFNGLSQASLITSIMTRAPIPLRQHRPDLPEDLEWVVARCLEKDPNRRFHRVADLAERLVPHGTAGAMLSLSRISGLPGQGRSDTVEIPSVNPPGADAPQLDASPNRPPHAPTVAFTQAKTQAGRRGLLVAAILGMVALLAVVAAAFVVATWSVEPPPLPPPPLAPPPLPPLHVPRR